MFHRRTALPVALIAFILVSSSFVQIPQGRSVDASTPVSKVSNTLMMAQGEHQRIVVLGSGSRDEISAKMHLTYTFGNSDKFLAFGTIKRSEVMDLASLPQVEKIFPDVKINYNDSRLDKEGGGLLQTNSFRVRNILGVDKVNSKLNVNGSGVNVAIVDTGTDFGNPELTSAVARYKNGVPIALDPDGGGIVLTNATAKKLVNSTGVYLDLARNGAGTKVWVYIGAVAIPFPVVQSTRWNFFNFKIGTDPEHYIKSVTGEYHFGLAFEFTSVGPLLFPTLLVDSKIAGAYDTVYMDLQTGSFITSLLFGVFMPYNVRPTFNFWNTPPHHVGDGTEAITVDLNEDGVPDISAGLLGARVLDVFGSVSSGKSNTIFDVGAVNGSLLLPIDPYGGYYGIMYDFEGHGTQTASNVASRGVRTYDIYGNGTRYKLQGVAPGAHIIAVKGIYVGDILYGWMWTSGFDYNANVGKWVYSGKHRAEISSNSWGDSTWPFSISGSGYDVLSILEDLLSVPKSLDPSYPGTLFVHAGGNGGPGYGTVTPPGSSSFALTVGASTSWHVAQYLSGNYHNNIPAPYYGGPSSYYDDVISWSARGPSPTGEPKPDVVNIGAWSFTPTQIDSAKGNGSNAWSFFGGTSQATPLTAGVAALVDEALKSKGQTFDPFKVKNIIMSTAVDTGNDPFIQGAGRVDALGAVSYALRGSNLAKGVFSISTNSTYSNVIGSLAGGEQTLSTLMQQSVTIPTTPRGEDNWFAGALLPGNSATTTFTLTNPTSQTINLSVNTTAFQQVKEFKFSNMSIPGKSRYINLTRMIGKIPASVDMIVIRETFSFDSWSDKSINPLYLNAVTRLRLQVYNWNDLNHDGFPELGELAIVNTNYGWNNGEEVRITRPASKLVNTPLIGVFQSGNVRSYWYGLTDKPAKPVQFTMHVYYLKKVSWDWVTLGQQSLSIAPKSTSTLSATLSVPSDASPGIYEGIIRVTGDNGQSPDVPVSVVVPITASKKGVPFVFGGANQSRGIMYDNSAVWGANDLAWRYEAGNWRVFKLDVSDPTVNQGTVRVDWTSRQTSISIFILNPQGRLLSSSVPPGVLKFIGLTPLPIVASPSNDYLGYSPFNNLTWGGGFAPAQNNGNASSIVQFPVNETGTYTIIVHNTLFEGKSPYEGFIGEAELYTILPQQVAPSVTLPQPQGFVMGNLTIPLKISGVGINNMSYSLDGAPMVAIGKQGNSTLVIDTTKLADGTHYVSVQVSDQVGHTTTKTVSFTVLNNPPSLFLGNPTNGVTVNGLVNITFKASGLYLARVSLTIDDKTFDVTGRTSYVWNSSQSSDGTHVLKLVASNQAGENSSSSVSFVTNNRALALQRSQQVQEISMLNRELSFSTVAVIIAVVGAAVFAIRRRKPQ